jgi:hypothetical protein
MADEPVRDEDLLAVAMAALEPQSEVEREGLIGDTIEPLVRPDSLLEEHDFEGLLKDVHDGHGHIEHGERLQPKPEQPGPEPEPEPAAVSSPPAGSDAPVRRHPTLKLIGKLVSGLTKSVDEFRSGDASSPQGVMLWVGGLPRALAEKESAVRAILQPFGQLESTTIRVKQGDYKSWCFATYRSKSAANRLMAADVPVPREPGCRLDTDPKLIVKLADTTAEIARKQEAGAEIGALRGLAGAHEEALEAKQRALQHSGPGAVAFERHGRRMVAALLASGGGELSFFGGERVHARLSGGSDQPQGGKLSQQGLRVQGCGDGDDDNLKEGQILPAATLAAKSAAMIELRPHLEKLLMQRDVRWDEISHKLAEMDVGMLRGAKASPDTVLLQLVGPQKLSTLSSAGHHISCFAIDLMADVVYTAGVDGSLIAWDFKRSTQKFRCIYHSKKITSIAVSGGAIYTGSMDETVCAVSAVTGEKLFLFDTGDEHEVGERDQSKVPNLLSPSWNYRNSRHKVRHGASTNRLRIETIVGTAGDQYDAHGGFADGKNMVFVGEIRGHLDSEERLAAVLGEIGQVVAVTLRHRHNVELKKFSWVRKPRYTSSPSPVLLS